MNLVQHTFETLHLRFWWTRLQQVLQSIVGHQKSKIDLLFPMRQWLDNMNVDNRAFAHRLCKMIPSQCPFEREVKVLGRTLLKIPPMCKLNPLYDEVIALRFRAMCYLADNCGEDISTYC
ncbi:MAG: Mo-dependent nitrogenase C-terminal domain-containing protein [Cyanobacteria bacterium J06600_6]